MLILPLSLLPHHPFWFVHFNFHPSQVFRWPLAWPSLLATTCSMQAVQPRGLPTPIISVLTPWPLIPVPSLRLPEIQSQGYLLNTLHLQPKVHAFQLYQCPAWVFQWLTHTQQLEWYSRALQVSSHRCHSQECSFHALEFHRNLQWFQALALEREITFFEFSHSHYHLLTPALPIWFPFIEPNLLYVCLRVWKYLNISKQLYCKTFLYGEKACSSKSFQWDWQGGWSWCSSVLWYLSSTIGMRLFG